MLKLVGAWSGALLLGASGTVNVHAARGVPTITKLRTYASGVFNGGGAEIIAHDPTTHRLYVVNAKNVSVDVVSIADPAAPVKIASVIFTNLGGSANSVAVHDGLVAVSVEARVKTSPGSLVFLDSNLNTLKVLQVGAQPPNTA